MTTITTTRTVGKISTTRTLKLDIAITPERVREFLVMLESVNGASRNEAAKPPLSAS